MVGPLGLPQQPTDKDFISCLRSGIVLCNAINKIQPGAVPKVVANQSIGTAWDIQPLPAYQYFENIRNFLDAVEELKLPSFQASDLERDTLDVGSAAKIVDCILALKTFHECQQSYGDNGPLKHIKSPLAPQSAARIRPIISSGSVNSRRLDMSNADKKEPVENKEQCDQYAVDSLVQVLSTLMFDSKENIDRSLIDLWNEGKTDRVKLFSKIMSNCLEEEQVLKLYSKSVMNIHLILQCSSVPLGNGDCYHWYQLDAQEKELRELKALVSETRSEFIDLQNQMQNDLTELGARALELSVAASGYHQAIKENRHLYNVLQELRGNIRVYCRIRPIISSSEKSCIEYIGNDGSLMVFDAYKPQNTHKTFQFNKVFGPTTTQGEVYKETQALIRSVMDGYNVCIFAYGQTGAGKTYTMCGPSSRSSEEMGINHMALNDLFQISCTREDIKYEIHVQMVEIYNEQLSRLLINCNGTLEIRNCSGNGGLSIPNARMQIVQSTSDVLNLMNWGDKNRAFGSTAMNHRSSRSHSVLTVHVHGKDISGNTIRSCLHLVDLAGSERVDKSEAMGDRLKEAQHINKSLSCLGDVIMALAQKNSHIPYRNSKLTQLLQNSLGGHAKMLMFAHVSPEADSYGETISTLKFAQRASTVELGTAHQNKESNEVRELKDQIDNLKKALTIKEGERVVQQHKIRESEPTLERSNQMMDRTPTRPRRLSIENGSAPKTERAASIDDRKIVKSPISRLKYTTENNMASRPRRLSIETGCVSKSGTATNIDDRKPVESEIGCSHMVLLDGSEANANMNEDNFISGAKFFQQSLPNFSAHTESRLPSIENTSRQQPLDQTRKLDEVTPLRKNTVNKYDTRSSIKGSIRKGSHIRKSLQSIGRLINGSEKRNNPCPIEAPSSKLPKITSNDVKSPTSADVRSRRRQSLTNIETLGSSVSRRSSLGGKSVDSSSKNLQIARTPPSAQTTKRWV
ncbi:kinesin-4 isoform X2 [Canna indica]|uniref:Kinesin-4 isoform X2 n=1 Tax=Canna indica TaxID=4628 RepID=A0AAQ3JVX9_9LILI|nr:kinesin-4 isoform X2 [Canna indica]